MSIDLRDSTALAALQACADCPYGGVVRVELFGRDVNAAVLRAKGILYSIRRDHPHLRTLQVRISPDNPTSELWIIKQEDDEPEPEFRTPARINPPTGPVEW